MRDARRKLHKLGQDARRISSILDQRHEIHERQICRSYEKSAGSGSMRLCVFSRMPDRSSGSPLCERELMKWLLSKKSDTGLLLRCCSVPAEWAGNEKMHKSEIAALRKEWEKLGSPIADRSMSCLSIKHLKEYLPGYQRQISLYEVLDQWGGEWPVTDAGEKSIPYSIPAQRGTSVPARKCGQKPRGKKDRRLTRRTPEWAINTAAAGTAEIYPSQIRIMPRIYSQGAAANFPGIRISRTAPIAEMPL